MPTVIRAVIGYFFLLFTLRFLSRRPGAQMTPFEFVIVFLMGGVIILATMGQDRSETNAICGVIAVALMHRLVATLKQRYPRFGAVVDGAPVVLMKDGKWQTEAMEKMRVQDNDVMAAARSSDVKTLDKIKFAILERQGAISIIQSKSD